LLTFDVNPELEDNKHIYLAAVDDQAELMRWHYHLGHLSFAKLKQLALNGEIPRATLLDGIPLAIANMAISTLVVLSDGDSPCSLAGQASGDQ
jgi:hypothetical protein